ncbi:MAG: hypothetical protein M3Z40_09540 [Bifidobacterium sp.]|nr:hypothetical protein [Bifidobacterium sp.]
MTQIPTALGFYVVADGNCLSKSETGKDKWVMVSASNFTDHIKQLSCSFVSDEDVADHLPLKCVSDGRAE